MRSTGTLLLQLQTTLDPEMLLEIFTEELLRLAEFDGLAFRARDGELLFSHGQPARSRAAYQLQADNVVVGQLAVYRETAFGDAELERIEDALSILLYPLRNALTHQEALRLARCDALTGLYNRAAFHEVLHREVRLASRHGEPFSLIVLDIDDFKSVNDTWGHAAGDVILRDLADILRGCSRRSDQLFRYAGDEFVLGTSHTSDNGATVIAQRILESVAATEFRYGDTVLPGIGVSIGIAGLRQDESADSLFERADQALYAAKAGGRNRIEVDSSPAEGETPSTI